MDKTTLINSALALMGHTEYLMRAENTNTAELWLPQVLAQANARYNWSFATAEKDLTARSRDHRESIFDFPSDCLTIIRAENNDTGRRCDRLRRVGDTLKTEPCGSIRLTYTSNRIATLQDLPADAPEFTQGVIELLAARLAPIITGRPELGPQYEQMAENHFMQAITRDVRHQRPTAWDPRITIRENVIGHL